MRLGYLDGGSSL